MLSVINCYKIINVALKHLELNHRASLMERKVNSAPISIVANYDAELITQSQLIRRLNISPTTLWRYRSQGMPFLKKGKKIFYDFPKVKKWLGGLRNDR